jgi:hypothetical protein
VIPLLLAANLLDEQICEAMPPEALNEQARTMAHRLFGRDHNPALYRSSGLMTQGLLEIWNCFCLSSKTQCADCAFASALREAL